MRKVKKLMVGALCSVSLLMGVTTATHAYILGDATYDGRVDLEDASKILRYALGIEAVNDSKEKLGNADVDKDGKITLSDAVRVLKMAMDVEEDAVKFKYYDEVNHIYYNLYPVERGVICVCKNSNNFPIELETEVVFYQNGKMAKIGKDCNYYLEAGRESTFFIYGDYNTTTYKYEVYDDYKVNFDVSTSTIDMKFSDCKNIAYKVDKGTDKMLVEFSNHSSKTFNYIQATVLYYDFEGNVIGSSSTYPECTKAGTVSYETFYYPYDEKGKTIIPASYKLYVDYAYGYDWDN